MPSPVRGLSYRARVIAYAKQHNLTTEQALEQLVTIALGNLEARKVGGTRRAATLSAEDRRRIARTAAQARWKGHQKKTR